jgi:hypothetical protein
MSGKGGEPSFVESGLNGCMWPFAECPVLGSASA